MKEVQAALSALKRESDSGSLYTTRMMAPPNVSQMAAPASTVSQASAPPVTNLAAAVAPPAASSKKSTMIAVAAVLVVLIGGGGAVMRTMKQHAAEKAAAELAARQAAATPEPVPAPPPLPPDTTLTNDNVAEMVTAKVPTDLILSQIRSAEKTDFDLSTAEIIRLSKAGVSPLIIEQMRNPKRGPAAPPPRQAPSNAQNAKQPPPPPTPVTATATAPAPLAPVPIVTSSNSVLAPSPVPTPAAAPAASVPGPTVNVVVPDTLPLKITLAVDIPANADVGRPLRFTVTDDFKVGSTVVLPKGAAVYGEISEAGRKKMFGIGGTRMSLQFTKAEAPGGHSINVRALAVRKTDGATQRPVDTGQRQPKDLAAAKGTEYIAYTDGEQPLTLPRR